MMITYYYVELDYRKALHLLPVGLAEEEEEAGLVLLSWRWQIHRGGEGRYCLFMQYLQGQALC